MVARSSTITTIAIEHKKSMYAHIELTKGVIHIVAKKKNTCKRLKSLHKALKLNTANLMNTLVMTTSPVTQRDKDEAVKK